VLIALVAVAGEVKRIFSLVVVGWILRVTGVDILGSFAITWDTLLDNTGSFSTVTGGLITSLKIIIFVLYWI
jgi:hypothetical protein